MIFFTFTFRGVAKAGRNVVGTNGAVEAGDVLDVEYNIDYCLLPECDYGKG